MESFQCGTKLFGIYLRDVKKPLQSLDRGSVVNRHNTVNGRMGDKSLETEKIVRHLL